MDDEIKAFAERLLVAGADGLHERDRRVLARLARRQHVTRHSEHELEQAATVGQRLADRVAAVGGSWGFVAGFALFLALWAGVNAGLPERLGLTFDPYPFIFLNLLLSMLAAIQAPIIMMSQNRQGEKDRVRAGLDYEVNLKAELEIMALHDKLDRLREEQTQALLAIQGEQVERIGAMLREMLGSRPSARDDAVTP